MSRIAVRKLSFKGNKEMKYEKVFILLSSILLLNFVPCDVKCAVSKQEAIQIVIDTILEGDTSYIYLYIDPDSLPEGKPIISNLYNYYNSYTEGWFFLIDDCPTAYWAHPCRYIFLNDSRYYSVSREMWFPNSWAYFTDTLELLIPGGKRTSFEKSIFTPYIVSMDEAIEIVIDSILEGDTTVIDLYINPNPGDTMVSGWSYTYVNPYPDGWFFFIDDAPPANWTHPCRYIFLSDERYYTVIQEMTPPDNIDSLKQIISHGVQEHEEAKSSPFLFIYPNPFCQKTAITYSCQLPSKVSINVFDVTGRLVNTLIDGAKKTGHYGLEWNAEGIASGVYFLHFTAGDFKKVHKMIVIR